MHLVKKSIFSHERFDKKPPAVLNGFLSSRWCSTENTGNIEKHTVKVTAM